MPFDTHQAYKRLQEDDIFTPEQAERIAQMERRLLVAGIPAVAAIVTLVNYLMG